MKFSPEVAGAATAATSGDRHTRGAIVQLLLEAGPITAGEIGERLGISAAGVRRHLDALLEAGEAQSSAAAVWQHNGRGRPARRYRLTAAGRAKLGHAYDDLAAAAMRQLREIGGDDAVRTFARRRIDTILSGVTEGSDDVESTVDRVADALTKAGYAATATQVSGPLHGIELCQHHCPVSHVAEEFPELCETEREAFAEVLGTHVQRLATIVNGDCACTTHVPLNQDQQPALRRTAQRRSHHDQARSVDMTTTPEALTQEQTIESLGRYGYGWADSDVAGASAQRGLSEAVVRDISAKKSEPEWMLDVRLKALRVFDKKPMPNWGSNLEGIHFDNIKYFVRSSEKQAATWDDLPADIKNTYDKLGIPEAEKQRLVSGVAAQYESEVVYHSIREDLEKLGVIFLDTDTALKEHPELFKQYFGTVIPAGDNKFSALNTAVWSGGSFIYVPQGCARRHPAAGLLPDQHREHGPVRADADHRRRGCLRALRRGLHRADLQERLAALRGGRDHREARWPLPLHDHSELVEQRLQPGHQAGPRRGRRHHGVGRRQHRVEGHDEVPGRVDDR